MQEVKRDRVLAAQPRPGQSLSARLTWLIVGFVMLAQILLFIPTVANYWENLLANRLDQAHLATRTIGAKAENGALTEIEAELLRHIDAQAVVSRRLRGPQIRIGDLNAQTVAAVYDLRTASVFALVRDAFAVMVCREPSFVKIVGPAPQDPFATIEIVMEEYSLCVTLQAFAGRIMAISFVTSLIAAALFIAVLQWLMVRPMQRLTSSILSFRTAPEDVRREIAPTARADEIGIAERQLAEMQRDLRLALVQKTRLAALGEAVAKINHDLGNILATAQLVSDRLAGSTDPEVKRLAPRLVASLDRAIALCGRTLAYGRAEEPPPNRQRFCLKPLLEDVVAALGAPLADGIVWANGVADALEVLADRDQLFRVLLNIVRNAAQALQGKGEIRVEASRQDDQVVIDISDTGPGLSDAARAHLFEPFRGGARAGGCGLGLAIAKELMRAHGGDVVLARSGPSGTTFRLELPDR